MKITNGIKAFEDYWVECQYSADLSVLTTIDPSLKNELFPYENSYRYEVTKHTTSFGCTCYHLESFLTRCLRDGFFTGKRSITKNPDRLINKIKRWIRQGEFVYAGVDLFYVLPNTICWEKFHWYHYTFVTGFDEEKDEFYILEYTLGEGYKEYAIPTERFKKAIAEGNFKTKVFTNRFRAGQRIKELTLDDIEVNAGRIVKTIDERDRFDVFAMNEIDYHEEYFMDLNGQHLFAIMNHHMSNRRMFEILKDKAYIPDEVADRLIDTETELIKGWNSAKISLFKLYKTKENRQDCIAALNTFINTLLDKERAMWTDFLAVAKGTKRNVHKTVA